MMQLSQHFSLEELTASEIASRNGWLNQPTERELANLKRLATFLEAVRTIIGKPIIINSGYRAKIVNDALGSNDRSHHRYGCAADIKVHGMTPREVCQKIIASGLAYDQVIKEFDAWVHISIPIYEQDRPRRQALTIDRQGARQFA